MDAKVVSRTVSVNSTDALYLQKEYDVLLIGKDDKTISLLQGDKIIPLLSQTLLLDSISTNIDVPITVYPSNQVTMQRVSASNTSTAPVPNQAGILNTYRFVDDAFSYQEYKSMQSTSAWRRIWDKTNGVWGAWGQ